MQHLHSHDDDSNTIMLDSHMILDNDEDDLLNSSASSTAIHDLLDEFLYPNEIENEMEIETDHKFNNNEELFTTFIKTEENIMNHSNSTSSTSNKKKITNTNNMYEILIDNTVTFGNKTELSDDEKTNNEIDMQNRINEYLSVNNDYLPHQLVISKLPENCRVENQININLKFNPPLLKQNIVHLPSNCISKQKLLLTKKIINYPKNFKDEIGFLEAYLLSNSTNKLITVCSMCVKREQRRASRRKSGLSDNMLWCTNKNKSALIFNNKQIFPINNNNNSSSSSIELIARMVCYTRHHKSNDGFKILFVLKNSNNDILAKNLSSPIQIMDKKPLSSNSSISTTTTTTTTPIFTLQNNHNKNH
ncbi:hypothetical protein Kpol_1073p1, partial [Vanderwaltozyma polyspora DSM 70294]